MVKFSEILKGKDMEEPVFTAMKRLLYFNKLAAWLLTEYNGFKMIDYSMKRTYEIIFALEEFYAIEFDTMLDEDGKVTLEKTLETIDAIDKIMNNKAEELVYHVDCIQDVIYSVEEHLQEVCRNENSVQGVLKEGIEKLISKIPEVDVKTIDKWMKQLPKTLDKMSPENKEIINNVLKNQK